MPKIYKGQKCYTAEELQANLHAHTLEQAEILRQDLRKYRATQEKVYA